MSTFVHVFQSGQNVASQFARKLRFRVGTRWLRRGLYDREWYDKFVGYSEASGLGGR